MRVRTAGAVLALLAWAPSARTIVLGEVDVRRVAFTVKQGQKIREELKAEYEKRNTVVKADEAAIVKLQEELAKADEEFRKQSAVMNEQKRAETRRGLQERFAAIQRKRMELARKSERFEGEMQTMEGERNAPLLERIRKVVESVSKEANVEFTYSAAAAPIIYAKETRDLTDEVIKRYDARHK